MRFCLDLRITCLCLATLAASLAHGQGTDSAPVANTSENAPTTVLNVVSPGFDSPTIGGAVYTAHSGVPLGTGYTGNSGQLEFPAGSPGVYPAIKKTFFASQNYSAYDGFSMGFKNDTANLCTIRFRLIFHGGGSPTATAYIPVKGYELVRVYMERKPWNAAGNLMLYPPPKFPKLHSTSVHVGASYRHVNFVYGGGATESNWNAVIGMEFYSAPDQPLIDCYISDLQGWDTSARFPANPFSQAYVDEFGQLKLKNWDTKITSVSDMQDDYSEEDATFTGGYPGDPTGVEVTAEEFEDEPVTGKWTVSRRVSDGQWFLLTPWGNRFWSVGVTGIRTGVGEHGSTFNHRPPGDYTILTDGTTDRTAGFEGDIDDNSLVFFQRNSGPLVSFSHYLYNIHRKFEGMTQTDWYQNWRSHTKKRLFYNGINTIGIASDLAVLAMDEDAYTGSFPSDSSGLYMPFVHRVHVNQESLVSPDLNIPMLGLDTGGTLRIKDPFIVDFEDEVAALQPFHDDLLFYATNDNFMGIMIDGETPWGRRIDAGGTPETECQISIGIMKLDNGEAAKAAFVDYLENKYTTFGAFETAWDLGSMGLGDWTDVVTTEIDMLDAGEFRTQDAEEDAYELLRLYIGAYYDGVKEGFELIADEYESTASHGELFPALFMGQQELQTHTPDAVLLEIADHVDVTSVDYYGPLAGESVFWDVLEDNPFTQTDESKPVIIAEYSFVSHHRSSSPVIDNIFYQVPYAGERADALYDSGGPSGYLHTARFVKTNIVGAHWFKYVDQPVSGSSLASRQNGAFGIVDVTDQPYRTLLDRFIEFAEDLYDN